MCKALRMRPGSTSRPNLSIVIISSMPITLPYYKPIGKPLSLLSLLAFCNDISGGEAKSDRNRDLFDAWCFSGAWCLAIGAFRRFQRIPGVRRRPRLGHPFARGELRGFEFTALVIALINPSL